MPRRPGYEDALSLTVSLCLVYTLCMAGVRVWIRKGSFGLDDIVVGLSTIIALCHYATSYIGLAQGLGGPWSGIEDGRAVSRLNEAALAGVVTFIFALYLSKCAMLFFLSRITKTPKQLKLFLACNIATAVIGSTRWQVITALDIITEALLLALPVYLVWGLQMRIKRKAMIIAAFYLRLPVLGFSIGRNSYALQLRLPQTDPGMESGLVVIWLGVELAYALAASTLSALKGFTESFNSDFGLGFTRGKGEGSYGMSDVSGGSAESSKVGRPKNPAAIESAADASRIASVTPSVTQAEAPAPAVRSMRSAEEIAEYPPLKLRPERALQTYTCITTDAEHKPWRSGSRASSRYSSPATADDMVIMREATYEVQHDRAPMLPNGHHA
ncbi:hypothetical protein LTR53_001485 [Teratosphaeriaceae sp. CCFEE 6253]|nr:hypothetical protein LTR53_001485 [Teratosphaeriaceae sp. CCFEE 6253]